MTKFIEVNDIEYGNKIFINVNKIIYVHPMRETRACIRYANSEEQWAIVQTAESYDEICQLIRKAGE